MTSDKLREVLEVCRIRKDSGRQCRDCIFYGEECNEVQRIINPSEKEVINRLLDQQEEQNEF